MMSQLQQQILEQLRGVKANDNGADIVALEMVQGISISDDGAVMFSIEVDPAQGAALEGMRQQAERVVRAVPGVKSVTAVLTAEKVPGSASAPPQSQKPAPSKIENILPHVKHVVLVSSGKGGVGKSTVAANLAMAMARAGQAVGLLDADIYGPSQPRMMGLSGQKPDGTQGQIIPLTAHGVQVMSIGFMVDAEAALVWRGPMVQKALVQMTRDVQWGSTEAPLDVLVIDMPPGTGDVPLTIAQKLPVDGAVIVSTPQDIALIDARRGVEMFRKVDVPVLGVIENMSTHICSNCGHEEHVFGHGGAKAEAEKMGVPFLGEIPLSADIRAASDAGRPAEAGVYDGLAAGVIAALIS
jgi:ATP-binding protein involved in chromosome partitioning